MKLGEFEGTTEEFHDLIKNTGFDPGKFMKKEHKVSVRALVVLVLVFIFLNILVVVLDTSDKIKLSISVFSLFPLILGLVGIHIKYEKRDITIIVLIIAILIIAICLGQMSFSDVADKTINRV